MLRFPAFFIRSSSTAVWDNPVRYLSLQTAMTRTSAKVSCFTACSIDFIRLNWMQLIEKDRLRMSLWIHLDGITPIFVFQSRKDVI